MKLTKKIYRKVVAGLLLPTSFAGAAAFAPPANAASYRQALKKYEQCKKGLRHKIVNNRLGGNWNAYQMRRGSIEAELNNRCKYHMQNNGYWR